MAQYPTAPTNTQWMSDGLGPAGNRAPVSAATDTFPPMAGADPRVQSALQMLEALQQQMATPGPRHSDAPLRPYSDVLGLQQGGSGWAALLDAIKRLFHR